VDYLAPTLYFLDILIILYLYLRFRSLSGLQQSLRQIGTLAPIPILLANLLYSSNPIASIGWLIHLFLYFLFIFTFETTLLKIILPVSALLQILIASVQVFLGHSIGGLLYYVGERNVSVGSPGIALTTFMDKVVLRAYGTFSHPNILAGWLVVVFLILLSYKPSAKLKILYSTLVAIGIVLTGSRSAAISLFIFVVPIYLINNLKLRIIYFALVISPAIYFLSFGAPIRADISISERTSLQLTSLKVIKTYPVFGTGANASISTYPTISPTFRLLQPDHNSPTLLLSWFGFFGLIALIYVLPLSNLFVFIPLLPLLFLDHYIFTSPQGIFILLLYLRVVKLK